MSKQHEPGLDVDREWEAQERALHQERARAASAEQRLESGDGALVRTYRVLTRVLRKPVQDGLPPDFAAGVARIVSQRAAPRPSLESSVVRALAGAFIAAVAIFSVANGSTWLALVDFSSTTVQWVLTAVGCVVLVTLLPGRARRIHRAR